MNSVKTTSSKHTGSRQARYSTALRHRVEREGRQAGRIGLPDPVETSGILGVQLLGQELAFPNTSGRIVS